MTDFLSRLSCQCHLRKHLASGNALGFRRDKESNMLVVPKTFQPLSYQAQG